MSANGDNHLSALIRSEISKSLRSELPRILKDALARELAPLQKQVTELIEAVSFIDGRYDDMNRQLQSREDDIKALLVSNVLLKSNVKELSNHVSLMEQRAREANLEINGFKWNTRIQNREPYSDTSTNRQGGITDC